MNALPEIAPLTEELVRRLIEKHLVCYEYWREFAIIGGVRTHVGYSLRLCGINDCDRARPGGHPVPGCQFCRQTYGDLRRIAEWIIPQEKQFAQLKIDRFDHAFHIAPKERKHREEIVVTIEILHNSEDDCPAGEGEDECLRKLRDKLKKLGVAENRVSAGSIQI